MENLALLAPSCTKSRKAYDAIVGTLPYNRSLWVHRYSVYSTCTHPNMSAVLRVPRKAKIELV